MAVHAASGIRCARKRRGPGAGSELYRGLGSVVIGGLSLSALLTLLLIPPLLGLFLGSQAHESAAAPQAAPAE
jgi:hydrophobic/amphiphilic exporter-1 (mainly G- bacteria), HAE1 family